MVRVVQKNSLSEHRMKVVKGKDGYLSLGGDVEAGLSEG